jgi:hypothetical protein
VLGTSVSVATLVGLYLLFTGECAPDPSAHSGMGYTTPWVMVQWSDGGLEHIPLRRADQSQARENTSTSADSSPSHRPTHGLWSVWDSASVYPSREQDGEWRSHQMLYAHAQMLDSRESQSLNALSGFGQLMSPQGHLRHRRIDLGRWRPRAPNPDQEPDLVGGLIPEDKPVEPDHADRTRIIFCEVVAIYGEFWVTHSPRLKVPRLPGSFATSIGGHRLASHGEPSLIPTGVIMAIVFSAKINGDAVNIYSDNNYYSGE